MKLIIRVKGSQQEEDVLEFSRNQLNHQNLSSMKIDRSKPFKRQNKILGGAKLIVPPVCITENHWNEVIVKCVLHHYLFHV